MGGDFGHQKEKHVMQKLALGTVQFGLNYGVANEAGQVTSDEVQRILLFAGDKKIDVLDTAIAYGTSEDVLGQVGVDDFRVVTKLPSFPKAQDDISFWVREQVDASLKRLRQKKTYGLLLHRPQDLLGSDGDQLVEVLAELKAEGLVEKIGVSIYDPEDIDLVYDKIKIDLVQAPLNVVDRRLQSSGWLDRLKDNGVEVHVRSVFLQGLLLMEQRQIPAKFSRWSNLWDQWNQTLEAASVSPLVACLSYPLSLEQVDRVIVGVDSAKQLSEILEAAKSANDEFDATFMRSSDVNLINPSKWAYL